MKYIKNSSINNKGFTLIELLVVIVILVAIVSLAIPSLTSSMERNKEKINKGKMELLCAAAEQYASENLTMTKLGAFKKGLCPISLNILKENGYIDEEDLKDADGNSFIKENVTSIMYVDSSCIFTEDTEYCDNYS